MIALSQWDLVVDRFNQVFLFCEDIVQRSWCLVLSNSGRILYMLRQTQFLRLEEIVSQKSEHLIQLYSWLLASVCQTTD